jgi:hypothetical protein
MCGMKRGKSKKAVDENADFWRSTRPSARRLLVHSPKNTPLPVTSMKKSFVPAHSAWVLPTAILSGSILAISNAPASIIFDDFNVNEGHFAGAVDASGTTVGEDAALSSIDRVTTNSLEGPGNQLLHLVHDATATAYRVRHLSGGGTPASNIGFAITAASVDGFIGFYIKTTATGWETSINVDGPANTFTPPTGQMRGSTSIPIIADGQWHLYEWDLDAPIWGSIPGIATITPGPLPDLTYTIDSIYFRDLDGSPGPTADFSLDFVAKSDSGSIANLIPEPSSAVLLLSSGVFALSFGRRRSHRS